MKKYFSLNLVLCIAFAVSLSSCVNQKQIAYFQKGANQSDTITVASAYIPSIQPGDILSVTISSLNPAASGFFNPYSAATVNDEGALVTGVSSSGQSASAGYLVDANGQIELPIIKSVKVQGLTSIAARDTIRRRLTKYLKEPTVSLRFLNYKISVIGEVNKPSTYLIPNEKITLPEALSMAGDMTIYGKRDNVLIVRDNDGKKEFGRVNLNNREVYTSPYYYLHANDVVYVEPNKGRVAQTDKTYQLLPIVLSALSFIAIIISYSK